MTLGIVTLAALSVLLFTWPAANPIDLVVPTDLAKARGLLKTPIAAGIAIAPGALAGSATLILLGPLLAVTFVRGRRRARERGAADERRRQTVSCIDRVVVQLRAGASLSGSFVESLAHDSMLSGHPLRRVPDHLRAGVPLARALADAATETSDDDARLVATTVEVLSRTGGSAVAALDRIGDTIRERAAADMDARVQAQQATTSSTVLAGLPVGFAVLGAVSEPELASFYLWHPLGTVCVVVATGLVVAGWVWMDRLIWGRR